MSDRAYRYLFLIGGAWNTGAGIIGLIFYRFVLEQGFFHTVTEADELLLSVYRILFFTIGVIGLSLLLAAGDPAQNRALIFACAVGKVVPPVIWAWMYLTGQASWLVISGISVDFLFSFFYIAYLIKTRTAK